MIKADTNISLLTTVSPLMNSKKDLSCSKFKKEMLEGKIPSVYLLFI